MSTTPASDAGAVHFNDDGTAWVLDDPERWWHVNLDRPCDTCGGGQVINLGPHVRGFKVCDCIDGRHTFEIEVQRKFWLVNPPTPQSDTFRVSVVPGMVLPIRRWGHQPTDIETWIEQWEDGSFRLVEWDGDTSARRRITLPPDARPGMWAVLLKVHS